MRSGLTTALSALALACLLTMRLEASQEDGIGAQGNQNELEYAASNFKSVNDGSDWTNIRQFLQSFDNIPKEDLDVSIDNQAQYGYAIGFRCALNLKGLMPSPTFDPALEAFYKRMADLSPFSDHTAGTLMAKSFIIGVMDARKVTSLNDAETAYNVNIYTRGTTPPTPPEASQ